MTSSNEKDLRVAQELLLLTLAAVGEPVVLDLQASREIIAEDWAIDVQLNEEHGICVISLLSKDDV
jgi:hypothetical protein